MTFKWICQAKSQVQGLMHISGETVTISNWTWRAAKFLFFFRFGVAIGCKAEKKTCQDWGLRVLPGVCWI